MRGNDGRSNYTEFYLVCLALVISVRNPGSQGSITSVLPLADEGRKSGRGSSRGSSLPAITLTDVSPQPNHPRRVPIMGIPTQETEPMGQRCSCGHGSRYRCRFGCRYRIRCRSSNRCRCSRQLQVQKQVQVQK